MLEQNLILFCRGENGIENSILKSINPNYDFDNTVERGWFGTDGLASAAGMLSITVARAISAGPWNGMFWWLQL